MDTQNTRVTREQAADLAGVSVRQISRWSAAGLLTTHRPDGTYGRALYDPEELRTAPAKWRRIVRETQARRREAAATFELAVAADNQDIST